MLRTLPFLALALLPQAATAQPLPDPMQPFSAAARARPEYDPAGMRLGAFRLDGMAELRPGYDSNLTGGTGRAPASLFGGATAAAALTSGWSRHALGASAQLSTQSYGRTPQLDWQDWNLGGQGRVDLPGGSSIEARYRHAREHLDITSYDVQGAGITRPVPYAADEVQLAGLARLNRYQLLASGGFRSHRYEDLHSGGVTTALARQSFHAATAALSASYELLPGRHLTARLGLQQVTHPDASARPRDSLTQEAMLGVRYDFDGVWQGRAAFGWRQRDYQGRQYRPLGGPAFDLTLSWLPTRMSALSLTLARSIEESIQPNAVAYTRTLALLRLDHELRRNILLGGEVGLDHRAYQTTRQAASDLRLSLGPRWLVSRRLTIAAGYSHAQRLWSSGHNLDYARHLVEMRLRLSL